MRVGFGYDIHPLVTDRKLILGGVEVPFERGAMGHSDGDCLFHAVVDALLGASGLGDMGRHFPDTDPEWQGADSALFLKVTRRLLEEKRITIENIDAIIHLERPLLAPHLPPMIQNLANHLRVDVERVNLKVKRGEGIGAVGRGEAVMAQAVVLVSCH